MGLANNHRSTTMSNDAQTTAAETKLDAQFEQIAQQHLRIDTLEVRSSYPLDFPEVAVWDIRQALEAAYRLGQQSVK